MGSVLPVSRKRQYVILVFFSVWALALCGMLFYYTIARGEELRAESRLLAWREGLMDAVRGSIFASDGTLLAWTELHYDLVLDPHKLKYDSRALSAVEKMFGRTVAIPGTGSKNGLQMKGFPEKSGFDVFRLKCQPELVVCSSGKLRTDQQAG